MRHYFFFLFILLILNSCTSDKLPEPSDCDVLPTYEVHIKPIIDNNCTYSCCHDGQGGNCGPGDMRSFQGLEEYLLNGEFENRVIFLAEDSTEGMPPYYVEDPITQPDSLTPAQLELIRCWIENDYKRE